MCFPIFFELNEFPKNIWKLFVSVGGGRAYPYKWISMGEKEWQNTWMKFVQKPIVTRRIQKYNQNPISMYIYTYY